MLPPTSPGLWVGAKFGQSCTLRSAGYPAVAHPGRRATIVGTWLSLVERTLGVGEVASSNLVVPTILFSNLGFPIKQMGTIVGTERNILFPGDAFLSCSRSRIRRICPRAGVTNEESRNTVLGLSLVSGHRLRVDAKSDPRRSMAH